MTMGSCKERYCEVRLQSYLRWCTPCFTPHLFFFVSFVFFFSFCSFVGIYLPFCFFFISTHSPIPPPPTNIPPAITTLHLDSPLRFVVRPLWSISRVAPTQPLCATYSPTSALGEWSWPLDLLRLVVDDGCS